MSNEKRAATEAAAQALIDRAAGHYRTKNYAMQDELLECAAMIRDLKPSAERATTASAAPTIDPAAEAHQQAVSDLRKAAWERDPEAALSAQLRVFAAFDARAEEARREAIIDLENTKHAYEYVKRQNGELETALAELHAQRTAGGDAVAWRAWPDSDSGDITTSRAMIEAWRRNRVPFRAMGYIEEAPVAEAAAQADDGLLAELKLDPRSAQILAAMPAWKRDLWNEHSAAPTAQPTPPDDELLPWLSYIERGGSDATPPDGIEGASCYDPDEPVLTVPQVQRLLAHVQSTVAPVANQADDAAVDRFAVAMKAKMAASRAKGRDGWDDPKQCQVQDLARMLVEHVEKGDPVDIGNFAMMLWNRKAMGFDIIAAFLAHNPAQGRTALSVDDLPPLPRAKALHGSNLDSLHCYYTGEQMGEYARAALRQPGALPDGLIYAAASRRADPEAHAQADAEAARILPGALPDEAEHAARRELLAALLDANDICRSAHAIAERIATEYSTVELGTFFGAFQASAKASLRRQHECILANGGYDAARALAAKQAGKNPNT